MQKLCIYISILLSFLFMFNEKVFSAMPFSANAEVSKIENNLYGFDYNKETMANRIARLEKTIYGKASTGDLNSRIKRLSKDIFAEQIGLEIPPCEDTYREKEEVADSTVNYPIVDEIEQKLFNQTYKNRDFHTRIVTIERKLFGKIYDVDDYSTRMDRIKTAVMPDLLAKEKNEFNYDNRENYDENALSSSDLSGINSNRFGGFFPYGQRNMTRPYTNYGESDNSMYTPELTQEEELAELEYNTFGTEFSNDDTKTRIKRLNSVNRAKKSSKRYDSQKFQQRMSTAMEIGAMILMILAMVL